jgi:DNA-binding NarL/FixJ family response regulator
MSFATAQINDMATHVLAVDDNPADRNLLRLSLLASSCCYKLEYADRLSEGLAKLEKQRADVVLLDLNLPDSQGKATVERVMQHAPHVPILVLTGSDDDYLALQAVRSGAQDYIVKGQLDGLALSRAMRHAIERHSVLMASRQGWQKKSEPNDEVAAQDSAELRFSSASVPQPADITLKGAVDSLIARERGPESGECVAKSRQGYQGFVIEARVHEVAEGGFSVEVSIEDYDCGGVTEKKFYIPNSFEAPESAMETAMHAGRQRIEECLWARHGSLLNS